MRSSEKAAAALYRRIVVFATVINVVSAFTLWALVWGAVAIVLRLTTNVANATLLFGAIGFPLVGALAARLAMRRFPAPGAVRAHLDHLAECGGMLMAGAERDLAGWDVQLRKSPQVQWQWRRPLGLLGLAAIYLALCLFLPIGPKFLAADARLDVSRETEQLGQQLKVLKEEKILDGERAENLKQQLEQVREQAAGKDPVKSLEALDHLHDVLRKASRKAAEAAAHEASTLGDLEAAAEAIQQVAAALSPSDNAKRMKQLSEMAQKAVEESEKLENELDSAAAAELAGGKLSANSAGKLGAAAKAAKNNVKRLAKNLHNAKLIDADQLKQCEGKGKCDAKDLADFLKKNPGQGSLDDAMGKVGGRGGVNEGPGAADLQFGEKSSADGAKFREESLPPGALAALKDSEVVGLSSATPERDKQASPAVSGVLKNAASGGGSANAAVVLPQHRGAVGRYFERTKKE